MLGICAGQSRFRLSASDRQNPSVPLRYGTFVARHTAGERRPPAATFLILRHHGCRGQTRFQLEPEPISASAEEARLLQLLRNALESPGNAVTKLVAPDGESVELPESVYRLLVQTVREMAEGHAVAVIPVHAEITTQEAADLLGVSRPYLIKLLDETALPCTLTAGGHRRVRLADVLAYRRVRDDERRAALDEMSAEAERLGLRY